MAKPLKADGQITGQTYYFWIYSDDWSQVWRVDLQAFENYNASNRNNYRIAATEGTSGRYGADVPAGFTAAGHYYYALYDSSHNPLSYLSELNWSGTAEITLQSGVSATVSDKTGYKLAADGLDSITNTSVDQAAVTSGLNFRQKIIWLFQRWSNKVVKDASNNVKVYDDSGSVCSTQAYTAASSVQTLNKMN